MRAVAATPKLNASGPAPDARSRPAFHARAGETFGAGAEARTLPEAPRRDMERRLGFDFGDVRIHTGARAAALSDSLGAEAFTVGRHVFFGADRFRPESRAGRRLLAHELVHTRQQAAVGPRVQRTIRVTDPGDTTPPHTRNNGELVRSLFTELCRDFAWNLSGSTIEPADSASCETAAAGGTPESCECVCHFTSEDGPHADIVVNETDNNTIRTSTDPETYRVQITGTAVTGLRGVRGRAPRSGSPLRELADPPWLVLGHELCGHALTTYPSIGGPGPRMFHQMTEEGTRTAVDIENVLRREHGAARGTPLGIRAGDFVDPDGNVHYGSLVTPPAATTPSDLLRALGLPVRYTFPRCALDDYFPLEHYFHDCGVTMPTTDAEVRSFKVLNRVTLGDDLVFIPWACRNVSLPAGSDLHIEGVFWHRAAAGETKRSIARTWRVSVSALNRANRLFNSIDALAATDPLPGGQVVVIPYNAAPGTERYFLRRYRGAC